MFRDREWESPVILVNLVDYEDMTEACIKAAIINSAAAEIVDFSLFDKLSLIKRFREELAKKLKKEPHTLKVSTLYTESLKHGYNKNQHTFRVLAGMAFNSLSHSVYLYLSTIARSPKSETQYGITATNMYCTAWSRTRELPAVQNALLVRLYAYRRVTGKCMEPKDLNAIYRTVIYSVRTMEQIMAAKAQAEADGNACEWSEAQRTAYMRLTEALIEGDKYDAAHDAVLKQLDELYPHYYLANTTREGGNQYSHSPLIHLI